MKILGIETSCDETAAAVVEGNEDGVFVLSNVISSQIDIHKKYGGVVPEVAAREHVLNILPVIDKALKKADIDKKNIKKDLDAIAVATGPGLITSLLVGVESAKTLAYSWNIPIISINHIAGHIYANFIGKSLDTKLLFPSIILTVSGGHTMLVLMRDFDKFETIGETRDDAAGEAFDKAAKMLGLSYPGGPIISSEAEKYNKNTSQNIIKMPRPMISKGGFDFSFSGLKTALRYAIEEDKNYQKNIPAYAHEFQQAIIDVLISKTISAAKKYRTKSIMLTGGVSANKELRFQLAQKISASLPDTIFKIPDMQYTTDNAAMVACAGYYKAKQRKFTKWQDMKIEL